MNKARNKQDARDAKSHDTAIYLKLLVQCPQCMHPIAITSLRDTARCVNCLGSLSLSIDIWQQIARKPMRAASAKKDAYDDHQTNFGDLTTTLRFGRRTPSCNACARSLVLPETLPPGDVYALICLCGAGLVIRRADLLATTLVPNACWLFGEDPARPLAANVHAFFACNMCGCGVHVTPESANATCAVCHTRQAIPVHLRHTWHPLRAAACIHLLTRGPS